MGQGAGGLHCPAQFLQAIQTGLPVSADDKAGKVIFAEAIHAEMGGHQFAQQRQVGLRQRAPAGETRIAPAGKLIRPVVDKDKPAVAQGLNMAQQRLMRYIVKSPLGARRRRNARSAVQHGVDVFFTQWGDGGHRGEGRVFNGMFIVYKEFNHFFQYKHGSAGSATMSCSS